MRVTMLYGSGVIKNNALTGNSNNELANIHKALQTQLAYDNKHGYRTAVLRQDMLESVWSKPAWLLHILINELSKPFSEQKEWLMWYDADTIIMNDEIPLDIFLPPANLSNVDLLVTQDHNGLNNGVFFIRVGKWAITFLASVLALPIVNPTLHLRFRDQSAMEHLLQEEVNAERTAYVPMSWFNGYTPATLDANITGHTVRDAFIGCLLVHLAGSKQKRYFDRWLRAAKDQIWTTPLQHTQYLEDIAAFWTAFSKEGR